MPVLQIQDFNRGWHLGQSRADGRTCPFRTCNVKEFWNFGSPKEYSGLNLFKDNACIGQDNKIDVWALGNVFYYLLSDGRMPFYYINEFNNKNEADIGRGKVEAP